LVPEPGTLLLLGAALLAVGLVRRKVSWPRRSILKTAACGPPSSFWLRRARRAGKLRHPGRRSPARRPYRIRHPERRQLCPTRLPKSSRAWTSSVRQTVDDFYVLASDLFTQLPFIATRL